MNSTEEEKLLKFSCSKCGKIAKVIYPMFVDRTYRLELPMFFCNICGLFYIDEKF